MPIFHILVLILISLLTAIFVYFKIAFNYWRSRNVPHLEPTIPHGNFKDVGRKRHVSDVLCDIYRRFKGTAKFCGVYSFTQPVILLLDLDLIKTVLITEFANFADRGVYSNEKDDPLSAHLFSLEGAKWRTLRAKITPTFTSGKMKFMFPTIVEVGERFRARLHKMVSAHDVVEMKELLARVSTDVIGTCAFGIECNSVNDENAEFRDMGRAVFDEPRHNILVMFFARNCRDLARRFGLKFLRDDVAKFFMDVVRETVEQREKHNIQRNDFMDLMIKLKNGESDVSKAITLNEIAAQAFIFFIAGFETSSTTLGCCLHELALHPQIQAKAREEVQNALKKHNGKVTYEMILDMPYLDNVINETLRKHPPATPIIRQAQSDFKVPGTDHIIAKGTQIFVDLYSLHRDPDNFPDPERFDPDRFAPEEVKKRNPMAFIPFGEGPRNCIGLRFGLMQTRVGLVMLLSNFEFSTCSETLNPLEYEANSPVRAPKSVYLKLKAITPQ